MKFDYVFGENIEFVYPGVTIHIERIYPSVAKEMLKTNIHNRDEKANPLVKEIVAGQWKLNGAAIVFSNDGILLDGQHRLRACVNADMPIDTFVVRGIDMNAQMSIDVGKKRNVNDYLKLMGYKNYVTVASIGSAMQRLDEFGMPRCFNKPKGSEFSVASTVGYIVENYESRIEPIVRDADNIKRRYKGVCTGIIGVIIDTIKEYGAEQADIDEFLRQLRGVSTPCHSVYVLQQRLDRNANDKMGKLPQEYIGAFVIKGWNAYITGEDLKILKYAKGGSHPQEFPKVIVP